MFGFAVFFIVMSVAVAKNILSVPTATMPEKCEGKTFCFQKNSEYPDELFDKIMNDFLEGNGNGKLVVTESISRRQGNGQIVHDCDRDINIAPIHEIIDENDNVRFVAQSKKFQQIIRTESCRNPGVLNRSQWFSVEFLAEIAQFQCVERKIDYHFLVLSLDGTQMESVKVKGGLPVCCSCKLIKVSKS